MMMMIIMIYTLTNEGETMCKCLRCNYEWKPKVKAPKACPYCHSMKWNKARRIVSGEESCLAGVCSDCGGKMCKWTRKEIKETKNDLGFSSEDDFSASCPECQSKWESGELP